MIEWRLAEVEVSVKLIHKDGVTPYSIEENVKKLLKSW